MCKKTLIPLLSVIAFTVGVGNYLQLQGQGNNPLAGGMWERYSVKNAQGVETGEGPGWYFLVFTDDGKYLITAAPKGREKLPKPATDMTKDELVKHIEAVQFRRGTYTLTGNGSPYTLSVKEEINLVSPTLNSLVLQVWMENGEVRATPSGSSTVLRWRRVSTRGSRSGQ